MFSFLNKNRIPINPKLREYCIKSTNDSIRKMTEKYNEERKFKINQEIISNALITASATNPYSNNNFIIHILCLLSSATFIYFFNKGSK